MKKFYYTIFVLAITVLLSCGTPNDPESIIGGDGGYKIVSKFLTSGYSQDIIIEDTLAYITQGEGGLVIFNISDRTKPVEVSSVIQGLKGYSNKIIQKDSLVFISAGSWGVTPVDISIPSEPRVIITNVTIKPAEGLEVLGDFLFTAIGEEGFQVARIVDVNQLDPRGKTSAPGFVQAISVLSDTSYLLVACGEMGFAYFNISELQSGWGTYPLSGWKDTPGYAEDVTAHPTLPYAFLACGTGGLQIVDYSDSANVNIIGSYSTGGYAKEVVFKENLVYLTTEMRGVQIFDVSNVSAPMRIGTVGTKFAKGLTVDDKYVYVADEQEGLIIISKP